MSQDEDTRQKTGTVIRRAIDALNNVPSVGDIFDQQHAETHLQAVVELRELLGQGPGPGTHTSNAEIHAD